MNRDKLQKKIYDCIVSSLNDLIANDNDVGTEEFGIELVDSLLALIDQQREEVLDELDAQLHDMIWTNSPQDKTKVFCKIAKLKKGEVR